MLTKPSDPAWGLGVILLILVLAGLVALSPATTRLWPDQTPQPSATASNGDKTISTRLKRQLIRRGVDLGDVRVSVRERVAYLRGWARDPQQRRLAVATARQTPGIRQVDERQLRQVVELPPVEVYATRQLSHAQDHRRVALASAAQRE